MKSKAKIGKGGFTLVELMVVMAIGTILVLCSGLAIKGLKDSGSVNKAIGDVSGTLELARTYAMAHNTYVRVAIAKLDVSASQAKPIIVVLSICSADGSLDADSATDMADPTKWPAINRPLLLDNFVMNDSLNSGAHDSDTKTPSQTDIAAVTARSVPGLGKQALVFSGFIQYNPNGEASISKVDPIRYIKLGMDQSVAGKPMNRNPFVLRVVGSTGSVSILRKEDGI